MSDDDQRPLRSRSRGSSRVAMPEPAVIMYTISGCVHCAHARRILRRLAIAFDERTLDHVPEFRAVLVERTGGSTVPQILIGGEPIGGARELARLQRRGVLLARVNDDAFPVRIVHRRLSPGTMLRALVTRRGGVRRASWRDVVELRDRDGTTIEREASAARRTPDGR